MLRKLLLFLIPILALGCGGQGTYHGNTTYVGSYNGSWTCPANGHTGTMTLSVSPTATMVGTYVDTTSNVSGQITGNVEQSGGFHATVALAAGGQQTMTGAFSITNQGESSAVLSGNATVGTQAITFSLPADTASGPSAYQGSFTGNWTSPLNGHYGTLSMTISANSAIVGSFADAVASTSGAISGTVDPSGAFVATVGGTSSSQTLNGQLSVSNGTLSGNATLAGGGASSQLSFTLSSSQTVSTYAGSFTGSWSAPGNGHTGTISMTISPNANITGSFVDTTANTSGSITGTVSPTGAFNSTINLGAGSTEGFSGQLATVTNGLSGNGNLTSGGTTQALSFSLTTGSTTSTYAGSFAGSWQSSTDGHTGTISWTIAPNAAIIGTYLDTTNSTAGAISGTVNQSGYFNATVTFSASSKQSLTGQLTVSGASGSTSLSGNGTLNNGAAQTITFSLPAVSVVSPFWGTFGIDSNDTWTDTKDGGTILWTIGPDGSIVGQFSDQAAGTVGIMVGTVDANGHFAINVTVNGVVTAKLSGDMSYGIGSVTTGTPPGVELGDGTLTAGSSTLPFQFGPLDGTNHNTTEGSTILHGSSAAPSTTSRVKAAIRR